MSVRQSKISQIRRLVGAFAVRICDMYNFLVSRLIFRLKFSLFARIELDRVDGRAGLKDWRTNELRTEMSLIGPC